MWVGWPTRLFKLRKRPKRREQLNTARGANESPPPKIILPVNRKRQNKQQKKPRQVRGESKEQSRSNADVTYVRHIPIPVFNGGKRKAMLRYMENALAITSTTGSVGTYVFSANGMYDPNITGTGHQPMGFDQIMLSYNHYVARHAKIQVLFRNTSTTYPVVVLSRCAAATAVTDQQRILEEGNYVKTALLPAGVQGCTKILALDMNIAKFGGVDDLLDRDDYQGDTAANPVEQSYFHIQVFTEDFTTATVNFEVIIEYDAVFTEPRINTTSLSEGLESILQVRKQIETRKRMRLNGLPLARVPVGFSETGNLMPSSR